MRNLLVAPGVDVGLIYVFALSSIAVYGVILGGWASNNKYSFLGGLRSSAQLIAYEIPMGLGILGIILCTGSLKLDTIIGQQAATGWWNIFHAAARFYCLYDCCICRSRPLTIRSSRSRARINRRLSVPNMPV